MFLRFRSRPRPPELPRDPHIRRDIGLPPLPLPESALMTLLSRGAGR
jgi:hypothetical protein